MILSYDIPFAFHDDPALDFLGQPAQDYSKVEPVQMMMENSKIESMAGMESIDNFSIDEWINI